MAATTITADSPPVGTRSTFAPTNNTRFSPKSSQLPLSQGAAAPFSAAKAQKKNTALKPQSDGQLRHSLLFIRKLLQDRDNSKVYYDESQKMNMMYKDELVDYLDKLDAKDEERDEDDAGVQLCSKSKRSFTPKKGAR